MPLKIFKQYYTRGLVRRDPECFYVFGDNVERRGTKGQAVIRGLPNAIGVATKWKPTKEPDAYFADYEFGRTKPIIDADISVIEHLLKVGRTVYLPVQMIGSGLSMLPANAPNTFAYVDSILHKLYTTYKDEGLEAFTDEDTSNIRCR